MVLLWIKKSLQGKGAFFKAGDVFLMERKAAKVMLEIMKSKGLEDCIEFIDLIIAFEPFVAGDTQTMLVIRSGGIGDLLALSALRNVAPKNNMIFITQEGYRSVFDWWERPPQTIIDSGKPIFHNVNFMEWSRKKNVIKRFFCDGIIEEGDRQNWYEIFYASMGANVKTGLCRPRLIKTRICNDISNIDTSVPSIVVCPRASANMRSMAFEPIYKAIVQIIRERKVNVYLHEVNATQGDRQFIQGIKDKRIILIKPGSIKEFMLDLYDCDMTISVDSAPVHFREGIEKPGIGIYSSFTTEARTKHYQVTYSFDVESPCRFQPCFKHQTELNEVCQEAMEGSLEAPCLTEGYNPGFIDQLVDNMKDYLIASL